GGHGRREPTAVDEDDRGGPQPGEVVHRHVGRWRPAEAGQVRPDEKASPGGAEVAELLVGERGLAAEQVEDGAREGQRLQVESETVLEEADTHDHILSVHARAEADTILVLKGGL